MTEPLDGLLVALEVEVEAFAICEVSRGWRLMFDPGEAPTVHYGLMGLGVLALSDGRRVSLARDTLLILPAHLGLSFELPEGSTCEQRARARPEERVDGSLKVRAGTDDVEFAVACGTVRARYAGILDIFEYLGDPIVETFEDPRSLRSAFEAVLAEIAAPTVGTRALTSALLKQCLVLLLRRHSASNDVIGLRLSTLGDARIARVIRAMVEQPAATHAIENLARIAGMSRSAFIERFSAVVGRSPISFLKEMRLRRAARLLEATELPVKVIAISVGYASPSYFSRAFRELFDVDPAGYRNRLP